MSTMSITYKMATVASLFVLVTIVLVNTKSIQVQPTTSVNLTSNNKSINSANNNKDMIVMIPKDTRDKSTSNIVSSVDNSSSSLNNIHPEIKAETNSKATKTTTTTTTTESSQVAQSQKRVSLDETTVERPIIEEVIETELVTESPPNEMSFYDEDQTIGNNDDYVEDEPHEILNKILHNYSLNNLVQAANLDGQRYYRGDNFAKVSENLNNGKESSRKRRSLTLLRKMSQIFGRQQQHIPMSSTKTTIAIPASVQHVSDQDQIINYKNNNNNNNNMDNELLYSNNDYYKTIGSTNIQSYQQQLDYLRRSNNLAQDKPAQAMSMLNSPQYLVAQDEQDFQNNYNRDMILDGANMNRLTNIMGTQQALTSKKSTGSHSGSITSHTCHLNPISCFSSRRRATLEHS